MGVYEALDVRFGVRRGKSWRRKRLRFGADAASKHVRAPMKRGCGNIILPI
jgi:hypothetical protein